ncbi:MAG: acyl-CoA dehydratase activase [Termitinemataceae bacterium]|nr:MAG: acyl-CoA dehydratase activase [Termitinemataceae bacterium]
MFNIGVDLGSTAIKVVIISGGEVLWRGVRPAAPHQEDIALELIAEGRAALAARGIAADDYRTAATGYGKKLFGAASRRIDEVSANAFGLWKQSGGAARIGINVGGQDLKIIRISKSGGVADFKMNDKCAAGTGRFFEQAARILDTPLSDFAAFAGKSGREVELSSTCVVFAESEIISLLAEGAQKEDILRALVNSVARRIAGFLGEAAVDEVEGVYLDGGPAKNAALASALSSELGVPVRVLAEPQFTVACGAALSLEK